VRGSSISPTPPKKLSGLPDEFPLSFSASSFIFRIEFDRRFFKPGRNKTPHPNPLPGVSGRGDWPQNSFLDSLSPVFPSFSRFLIRWIRVIRGSLSSIIFMFSLIAVIFSCDLLK
jgi:hypothetical protein